jgi:hypothetical protein
MRDGEFSSEFELVGVGGSLNSLELSCGIDVVKDVGSAEL